MALPADVLAELRAWVGTDHDATDLEARYTRLSDVHAVALEVLRQRRADFVATAARLDLDSDVAIQTEANIKALDGDIGRLEALVSTAGTASTSVATMGVSRLTRPSGRR